MRNVCRHDRIFDRARALCALFCASALLSAPSFAATTSTLDFQGFLKDSGGNVVDGPVTLTFRIFNAPQGGTLFWTDTISTTAASGSFFVNLGGNPADPLPIAQLAGTPDLYLEVEVSGDGQPMVPRFEMTGAVSAFYAQTAGDVPNKVIHPAQVVVATTGAAALQVNGVDVIDSSGKYIGPTVGGTSGQTGASGASGVTGPTGAGVSGASGATGATGADGAQGSQGPMGDPGVTGQSGLTGMSGASGATGATGMGATGDTGNTGNTGNTGLSGASGATGASGASGATGANGALGATGDSGASGASGASGQTGGTGSTGNTGASGASGATGQTGASGAVGQTGRTGATGATGPSCFGSICTGNTVYSGTGVFSSASASAATGAGILLVKDTASSSSNTVFGIQTSDKDVLKINGNGDGAFGGNVTANAYWGDGSHLTGVVASAAGASGQLQFNAGGVLSASSNIGWDNTNQVLTVTGTASHPTLVMPTAATLGNVATLSLGAALSGNTGGALIGANAPAGYGGDLLNLQVNGLLALRANANGELFIPSASAKVGIANSNPGALLDVGGVGIAGTLRLEGSSSGYVQIQPAAVGTSWTMTLPTSAGTNGYFLQTNGSGNLTWATDGSGLTNLSAANITSGTLADTRLSTNVALLGGRSGGQILNGGTATTDSLTLSSNATGTKTKIYLGALSVYDESTQRLGLNDTAPSADLSFGGDSPRAIKMEASTSGSGNALTISAGGAKPLSSNANGGDLKLQSGTVTGSGSSNIYFSTASGGTPGTGTFSVTPRMTILGNGNVGIGNMNPTVLLDVSGTAKLSGATPVNTEFGTLSLGDGGFSGGAAEFKGSASGTILAVNSGSSFSGNLLDLQTSGQSTFAVSSKGDVNISGGLVVAVSGPAGGNATTPANSVFTVVNSNITLPDPATAKGNVIALSLDANVSSATVSAPGACPGSGNCFIYRNGTTMVNSANLQMSPSSPPGISSAILISNGISWYVVSQ